ncbi:hypothetical protein [Nocardiopsis rhodophaea]|uniref:hypothetical protein n=1 Tax=Nocardiopsis rhodophaea TaxID=280238 RepID=UPI0031DFDAB1
MMEQFGPYGPPGLIDTLLDSLSESGGTPAEVTDVVEQVIGRPARSFTDWAADHTSDFTGRRAIGRLPCPPGRHDRAGPHHGERVAAPAAPRDSVAVKPDETFYAACSPRSEVLSSPSGLGPDEVDRLWWAYLRRFDIEHTFRFCKQQLGWDVPRLRDPASADRWSWVVMAAYTQLRLARGLVGRVRLPWHRPVEPGRMSPSRVRRGFRRIHARLPGLGGVPRPSRPSPGRPPGSRNKSPAPRYNVPKKNNTGTTSRVADKQAA